MPTVTGRPAGLLPASASGHSSSWTIGSGRRARGSGWICWTASSTSGTNGAMASGVSSKTTVGAATGFVPSSSALKARSRATRLRPICTRSSPPPPHADRIRNRARTVLSRRCRRERVISAPSTGEGALDGAGEPDATGRRLPLRRRSRSLAASAQLELAHVRDLEAVRLAQRRPAQRGEGTALERLHPEHPPAHRGGHLLGRLDVLVGQREREVAIGRAGDEPRQLRVLAVDGHLLEVLERGVVRIADVEV